MRVAVIGLGLIGGSLLRALAAAGHEAIGHDLDPSTRAMAQAAAALAPGDARWRVAATAGDAVAGADVAVLATPLPAVAAVLDDLVSAGFSELLTDVVSVKTPVRALVNQRVAGGWRATYVGGHPMAGREAAGFSSSDVHLFDGCAWVLCLEEETDLDGWLALARLFTSLGARVVPATAAGHDRAVAAISHVPHLLAAALATAVTDPLAATLAAGSFRDGTRVAASPPDLIAAMCGGNAEPVRQALAGVLSRLGDAQIALSAGDPIAAVRQWVQPAHAARVRWPSTPGDPERVPATRDALLALGASGGWVIEVAQDARTATAVRPTGGPTAEPAGGPSA